MYYRSLLLLCFMGVGTLRASSISKVVDCDPSNTAFSRKYADESPLIFRGKSMRVDVSGDYGKAQFKVSSLYKGKIGETVMVYFTKNTVPSILIQPGEDWILYCKYVTGKPFLDPCSRSRKNIINTNKNVELMYAKSEITVDEECAQLKEWFGIQIPKGNITESESHRNIIPDGIQRIVLTLVSVLVTIGIYFFISPRKKHNFKK